VPGVSVVMHCCIAFIVATSFHTQARTTDPPPQPSMQKLISMQAAGRLDRFEGWREWTTDSFEVRSGGSLDVGVDGEALTMEPPLVFTSRPGPLRVRTPRHATGPAPAASA